MQDLNPIFPAESKFRQTLATCYWKNSFSKVSAASLNVAHLEHEFEACKLDPASNAACISPTSMKHVLRSVSVISLKSHILTPAMGSQFDG